MKTVKEKILYWLFALFLFTCTFIPRMLPALIVLMLLFWLFEGEMALKARLFFSNKPVLLFSLFYMVYLAGLSYTSDLSFAGRDLETKLSIIIFPVILSSFTRFDLKQKFGELMRFFTRGCLVSAIICIVYACYRFGYELYCRDQRIILEDYPYTNYFFSSYLSLFMHYGHLSMYINLSVAYLFYDFALREQTISAKKKALIAVQILFLSVFVVMLYSKAGIITLCVVWVAAILFYALEKRKVLLPLLATLTMLFSAGSLYLIPATHEKIYSAINSVESSPTDITTTETSAVRKLIWKASFELIKESPVLGYGTGDGKNALLNKYKELGMTGALEKKLNAHNQFLQTWLSVGVIGILILILSLVIPFFQSLKRKNFIYTIFVVICVVSFLTESALETQAGVIFYAFFNSLFCVMFLSKPSGAR